MTRPGRAGSGRPVGTSPRRGAPVAARRGVRVAAWRGALLAAGLASFSFQSDAAPDTPGEPSADAGRGSSAPADAAAPRSPAEVTDFRVRSGAQMQARTELLQTGEAALRRGDTAAALDAFDRAALMLHAGDTEMLQVRAQLQAGRYREALAFCAHTVGAHRELAAPAALYAWLLQAGGQPAVARQVLAEAGTRLPGDPLLAAASRELGAAWPAARGGLLESPQRLAPEALALDGRALPDAARIASSGVLVDGGARALVPLGAVSNAGRIWLRNGLGQTVEASVERRLTHLNLALLRLARPLVPPAGFGTAPRDPFAGSVGHVVEYRAGDPAEGPDAGGMAAAAGDGEAAAPAWPWLHLGFFGALANDGGARRLGITLPAGPHGGPAFDAGGRLAGLAMQGDDGGDMLLPISVLRENLGDGLGAAAPASPTAGAAPRMAADEVYERALRVALQVIVAR